MAKKRGIGQITTDLERALNEDFNALIGLALEGFANRIGKDVSPVDTGFFASSWKASTQKVQAKDEKVAPWSNFPPGSNQGEIRPRHKVPEFNYKKQPTVYIGNTAGYAMSAFSSPKSGIPQFVQGEMRDLVNQTFKEKRTGRIFAQTGQRSVAPVGYQQLGG
tara:strand:+ start:257 stop:745 length:489 start_codon:yes stop_codon:yes gene_type:complete